MIILVDMDDTIEHLLKAWVNGVNEKYGCCVSCDEIVSWDVSADFPGLTHEQVLSRLISSGNEVYIVTATPYESIFEKMSEVLFKYFPFLSWDQVIVTSRKQLIRGDVLIDDGVHNLKVGSTRRS